MNWEERCMEEILLGFLSFNHKDTLRDSAEPDQNIWCRLALKSTTLQVLVGRKENQSMTARLKVR